MDARPQGTLSTSAAGFLFASFFFLLSALSALLRLVLPFHPTGANVQHQIRSAAIRRTSMTEHRKRRVNSSATDSSSDPSCASLSSSLESCRTNTTLQHPSSSSSSVVPPKHLEPPPPMARQGTHGRVASEYTDRPDFRRIHHRHDRRRSESTPPSPTPWAYAQPAELLIATDGHDASAHLSRTQSSESVSSPVKSKRLSFLRRKQVHKAPSVSSGLASDPSSPSDASPAVSVERRKSQLLHPKFLHRRRSLNVSSVAADHPKRRSLTFDPRYSMFLSPPNLTDEPEEIEDYRQHSSETAAGRDCRVSLSGKRSQTLRTHPYEAPYFFPAPGSVEADNYVPPRRRLDRSGTVPPVDSTHSPE